jgi:hypothetical protein
LCLVKENNAPPCAAPLSPPRSVGQALHPWKEHRPRCPRQTSAASSPVCCRWRHPSSACYSGGHLQVRFPDSKGSRFPTASGSVVILSYVYAFHVRVHVRVPAPSSRALSFARAHAPEFLSPALPSPALAPYLVPEAKTKMRHPKMRKTQR